MGIRYGDHPLHGARLFDFMNGDERAYSLLDYTRFTLFVFGERAPSLDLPSFVNVIHVRGESPYADRMLLVRPDAYIAAEAALTDVSPIAAYVNTVRATASGNRLR